MELEHLKPTIFDSSRILSGVTTKNLLLLPPYGLSLSNADILDDFELERHKAMFADLLRVHRDKMKYQQQTHSCIVRHVNADSKYENSDGMYTNEKGIVLNIKIADCTAVLIHDPVRCVVMGLHSGWRGTQQNITKTGIEILQKKFHSRPEDLLVYISPAASGKNYEVGVDVAKYFPRSVIPAVSSAKFLFDNRHEICLQLTDCGVLSNHIEVSPECTIDNTNLHSFRRDKQFSGRMSAFIGLV